MKGTYVLVINLSRRIQIKVGALGNLSFENGYYCYVGSAMANAGSSTLINRILRHLRNPNLKKIHWHIDYFLKNPNTQIVRLLLLRSKFRMECEVVNVFKKEAEYSISKFGSSDCKCESHLLYFRDDLPI
ncbi:MAG: DUF123 domain-containing protein [Candidatus Lokiarchaeota archaeon]|nr:DUF123 domain-containing protein [Candidatus Lokiarchaeota archaeon]